MPCLLDLRLACNTPDANILENVRSACARPLSWIERVDAHDRTAVLVGGGPSLSDQFSVEEMRLLSEQGAVFFALGNSRNWLKQHGLPVHFQVILDAREGNAEFVRGGGEETCLIASQCDPAVFDAVPDRRTILWHAYIDGLPDIAEEARETARFTPIVAHHTVGLTALNLAYVMGYRTLHLFGYDSSDRGDESHAFAQSLKTGFAPLEVIVSGQTFRGQPGMIGQAERFPRVAAQLAESGCEIIVHGDGLLPTIARLMNAPPPEVWRVDYDLSRMPASWTFSNWLVAAEMDRQKYGAKSLEIRFLRGERNDGLPESLEERQRLFENVMRPLLGLIGAKETDEPGIELGTYTTIAVVDRYEDGVALPVLNPSREAQEWVDDFLGDEVPIIITLREARYWPERNSNMVAWSRFARECRHPVLFVRDTDKADVPLTGFWCCPEASKDIHIRLALYKRALVNMMISAGPSALPTLSSDIPYLVFKLLVPGYGAGSPEFWQRANGLKVGEQFPWAGKHQRLIWADDTLSNIRVAFDDFMARRGRALELI